MVRKTDFEVGLGVRVCVRVRVRVRPHVICSIITVLSYLDSQACVVCRTKAYPSGYATLRQRRINVDATS